MGLGVPPTPPPPLGLVFFCFRACVCLIPRRFLSPFRLFRRQRLACPMSSFADNIVDVQSSRSGERVAGFIEDQRANMDAASSEHLAAEGSPPLVRQGRASTRSRARRRCSRSKRSHSNDCTVSFSRTGVTTRFFSRALASPNRRSAATGQAAASGRAGSTLLVAACSAACSGCAAFGIAASRALAP